MSFEKVVRVLASPKRLEILKLLDEHGSLRFSELMEKLQIEHSGQLSYHLSLLKEAGVVEAAAEGGHREYKLTAVGRRVVELLEEINSAVLGYGERIGIVDDYGFEHDYDAYEMVTYLRREFGIPPRKLSALLRGLESMLADLGGRRFHLIQVDHLVLSLLLRNRMRELYDENVIVGLRTRELERLLARRGARGVAEAILRKHAVYYSIPEYAAELVRSGFVAIAHLHLWRTGAEAVARDPLAGVQSGGDALLELLNSLYAGVDWAHSQTVLHFNSFVYRYAEEEGRDPLDVGKKLWRALLKVWQYAGYDRIGVSVDAERDGVPLEFTKTLLDGILECSAPGGSKFPALVLCLRDPGVLEELEEWIYAAVRRHVPLTLVRDSLRGELTPVSPSLVMRGGGVVGFVACINLPAVYMLSDAGVVEGIVRDIARGLVSLSASKRSALKGRAEVVRNNVSLLGGEAAIALREGRRGAKLTLRLLEEFYKMLADSVEDLAGGLDEAGLEVGFSFTDVYAYSAMCRLAEKKIKRRRVGAELDYREVSPLSPFSNLQRRRLKEVLEASAEAYRRLGAAPVVCIRLGDPMPTREELGKALEAAFSERGVGAISLAYDYTYCSYCGYSSPSFLPACPSCSSTRPSIGHYGRVLGDYRPLESIPLEARREYCARHRYSRQELRELSGSK